MSLTSLFSGENQGSESYVAASTEQAVDALSELIFTQAENLVDLSGRRGSQSYTSPQQRRVQNAASKRAASSLLLATKVDFAGHNSLRSYSYSCNFPLGHLPQRELFFILRNIRI